MKKQLLAIIKKQYLTIILLLFLLLILPLLLILVKNRQEIRPKATFGTINLALTPATLTKKVGETFEVEVQIIQQEAPTPTPTSQAVTPTSTPEVPTSTPTFQAPTATIAPTLTIEPLPTKRPTIPPRTPTSLPTATTAPTLTIKPLPTRRPAIPSKRPHVVPLGQYPFTQSYKISAANIILGFDKNILEIINVSLPNNPIFTDLIVKEIKNNEGTVHFSVIAQKATDQLSSASVIPVVKITFKAKSAGTSAVTFSTNQIIGYNAQNEDVSLNINQKTEGSYTVTGDAQTYVNFKIKFRGMSDAKPNLKVSLRVIDENKIKEPKYDFEKIEITADDNKVYSPKDWVPLSGIAPAQNYTLLIKGPKHLQKRMVKRIELFSGKDTRNNFDWTDNAKNLDPGDLPPQDGVCNGVDASRIIERYGSSVAEDLITADLNYDNIVNANDLSLLLGTLESKYEDEE